MEPTKKNAALLGKLMAGSLLFTVVYVLLAGLPLSSRRISDGLTLVGMLCMLVGLARLVNRIGLFDSTKFGWKKFIEVIKTKDYVRSKSEYPDLANYKQQNPYEKTFLPFLAASVLDFLLALLIA